MDARVISAFTRVHSPSKTGVNALIDALLPAQDDWRTTADPLHHISHHRVSFRGRALVKFRIHPAHNPLARERRLKLPANGGIFLMIRNGAAPFAQINGAIIHELLAGAARLARALVVGSVPGGDAQPLPCRCRNADGTSRRSWARRIRGQRARSPGA